MASWPRSDQTCYWMAEQTQAASWPISHLFTTFLFLKSKIFNLTYQEKILEIFCRLCSICRERIMWFPASVIFVMYFSFIINCLICPHHNPSFIYAVYLLLYSLKKFERCGCYWLAWEFCRFWTASEDMVATCSCEPLVLPVKVLLTRLYILSSRISASGYSQVR